LNDERLRALYQQAIERRRPAERTACLPPERLLALAEGRLRGSEAQEAADHAMSCASCREEYALLRAIARVQERSSAWSARRLALAASIVLALGAIVILRTTRQRDAATFRGSADEVRLLAPEPGVAPLTLAWRSVADASRYEVELMDSAGMPLHQATTRDTVLVVPETVRLAPGAEHRWWVRAVLANGREVRSTVATFRSR
jgi:hypothetical protein